MVVKDLDSLFISQFVGTYGDGMDGPIFGTYCDGMDGLTDQLMDLGNMDPGDMAVFICLLFSSEESMDDSGMSCSCESDSALLHLLCDKDESFEEVCEEDECFPNFKLSMRWSLDVRTIEVEVCINFEETQVLELLGGKVFFFGMNHMMPSFEQMMTGEE